MPKNQDQKPLETEPKKKKRGPVRRLLRLVMLVIVLVVLAVLTLPLWGSTGPGTSALMRMASMATGQEVQTSNLDLGYGGGVLLEDLRVGPSLTVEKIDLTVGLVDLVSGKIRLKGTITKPAYVAESSPPAERKGGGKPSGASTALPDAQVDLKIVQARAEIRHPGTSPEAVDRIEGLDAVVKLTCNRTVESLQAELTLDWQLIDFGGFPIEPSTLVVKGTPSGLTLEPSHLQVAGGTVDLDGMLTLDPGSEHLVFRLAADGIQAPGGDMQPIQGVKVSADLTGLDWIRGTIESGELAVGPLEILRRLQGQVAIAVKQLSHRFPEAVPVLGQNLVVSGLDGKVHFAEGVIRTENMNMLVQDTGVSVDLSSPTEGPVTFSLRVAGQGQPAGRLPVRNLLLEGNAPFSADSAKLKAKLDQFSFEGTEIKALDVELDYAREGKIHRADISSCSLQIDGATAKISGQAAYDEAGSASYVGKATIDGYTLAPEKGRIKGAALDIDLANIPTVDAANHLDQLQGRIGGTITTLPTSMAEFQDVVLAIVFAGGHAEVSECKATSSGGSVSAVARVFLGAGPGDLTFQAKADGLTLQDAAGPIQKFVAAGDLSGFAMSGGAHQPALAGEVTGSFDQLPLSAVSLDKGQFKATAKQGRIDLTILDFAAGKGRLTGKGFADLAQQPPEWSLEMANDKVGVRKGYGAVLAWVVPILSVPGGKLGGQLESTVQLAGRGFGVEDLRKTLTGSGRMTLSDGFLSGSPILQELVPVVQTLDMVGIDSIDASFDVGEGLVSSDDIDMNMKFKDSPIYFGLKGSVDFDTNIDYGIKLRTIEGLLPGNLQPVLQLLGEDATIPLHLQGTIAQPKVGFPSPDELMKQAGKAGLERLADDPGKLLDGIFGGKKAKPEEAPPPKEQK